VLPASCRQLQAGSLRSPDIVFVIRLRRVIDLSFTNLVLIRFQCEI